MTDTRDGQAIEPTADEILTAEELDEQVSEELADGDEKDKKEPKKPLPQWAIVRKVTVYGDDFVIEPPDVGITLRIINCFGILGVRGERVATRLLKSLAAGTQSQTVQVSSRAALFGILAALNLEDVYSLGSAVLQFADDREGRAFLRDAPKGQTLPLSPLIRALFLNVSQSTDLRDAIADFFDGLGMMENLLGGLNLDL